MSYTVHIEESQTAVEESSRTDTDQVPNSEVLFGLRSTQGVLFSDSISAHVLGIQIYILNTVH
jgi:hypothetical protein